MMVADGYGFSGEYVAFTGRRDEHDAIVDAKGQLTIVVHQCCYGKVSKCKKGSTLTNIATVEVGIGDGHYGYGMLGINFSNLTTGISSKAVSLI
jgi:hypothetical protein